jgi:hypothetical protein
MKTKSGFLLFFLFLFLTTSGTDGIKVNASKELGVTPPVFTSSIWIQNLENLKGTSYAIDKFFKDNKPAVMQLSLPILQDTKSFDDFKQTLESHLKTPALAAIIQKAKAQNTLVIAGYDPCPMPEWLSSNPGDSRKFRKADMGKTIRECSPPKDYRQWGEVVNYTMKYFKSLGLNNIGFYVGHEQDVDWVGNEESFFKYYEASARAAKTADQNIKVGGPGAISWDSKRERCDYYSPVGEEMCRKAGGWGDPNGEPFIKNFVEYVAKNHIPLDFINWHSFGTPTFDFQRAGTTINGWLKKNGLEKVYLFPADWTYWSGAYPADYIDTNESAAYIPQALYNMWKAGILWHGHDFDVGGYDNIASVRKSRNNSTFVGDWSIFTGGGAVGGGIIKPVYNSLKALSMLSGNDKKDYFKLLDTEFPDEGTVKAVSTISGDKKKISLLLSNFVPQERNKMKAYIIASIFAKTDSLDQEKRQLRTCMEEKRAVGKGKKDVFEDCHERLISNTNDPGKKEAIAFYGKVYGCLKNQKGLDCINEASRGLKDPETLKTAAEIKRIMDPGEKTKQVRINLAGIPFNGHAKFTTYRIDASHSNSCGYNKRTEASRTNAACGIGGAVDKAVWSARDQAKEQGIRQVRDYLLSLGYNDSQINHVKTAIEQCRGQKNMKKCLEESVMKNASRLNRRPEELKRDLKAAFETYKKTYSDAYYSLIDKVNNLKEISLEGSKTMESVNVKGNSYTMDVKMEPNSVLLIVLDQ